MNSKYEKPSKCFNLVVRHAERCDNSELQEEHDKVEVEWDPPLTAIGLLQAQETAKFLVEFLIHNKIDLVVIDSSPFLRCLQTAASIADTIGIKTIHINYLACEWLKGKFYPNGNPIGKLLVETLPEREFVPKYLGQAKVNLSNQRSNLKYVTFPELYY